MKTANSKGVENLPVITNLSTNMPSNISFTRKIRRFHCLLCIMIESAMYCAQSNIVKQKYMIFSISANSIKNYKFYKYKYINLCISTLIKQTFYVNFSLN